MVRLRAAHSNNPRLQPLRNGDVTATGIEFDWTDMGPQQLFHHQLTEDEFDVFEFSISSYMITKDRPQAGKWDWQGIPIFLSRAFLALSTHVPADSPVQSFADIKGRKFGVPDFNMTAALWMRAMIEDLYDVKPQDVTWYIGRGAGMSHGIALGLDQDPPKDVPIHWVGQPGALARMLLAGEIDGTFATEADEITKSPKARPLFTDGGRQFVADFVNKDGFTPVNHTLAVQRRVVEENPWVPEALFEAFEKSKQEAYKKNRSTGMLFKGDDYEAQASIFGADPYPSGLKANRAMLQRGMQQSLSENMIRKPVDVDSLWCESLRGS
jgi:4,5-dihydroxyphthalate decarboxylase